MATTRGAAVKKAAARPRKDEAARAEKNGQPKEIEYRGVTLTLPPKLLGSVPFRVGVLRDDDIIGASKLMQSILGEVEFQKVLDKMDEDGIDINDADGLSEVGELIQKALAQYGMSPGESQASAAS